MKMTRQRYRRLRWLLAAITLLLVACSGRPTPASAPRVVGGDPERGRQAIQDYGCQACHTIPNVPRADATVGPPLNDWADRHYIAGRLTNTPENLILWLRFPQEVDPGNAMPDMGVTEQDARDISAYLYTLQRGRGWWSNFFGR
jgi:cytochrome c